MQADSYGLRPFLKWAGGKRWLADSLTPYFDELRGRYFEPFLGSGAVFFRHLPEMSVLGDANAELIDCYVAIRDEPAAVHEALVELAKSHPDDAYYEIRASKPKGGAASAARFLYLNRTCWNGLYRVNLKGEFNVPRGTKTQVLLEQDGFASFSKALANCDISVRDFEDTIACACEGDLVFADPPYTVAHNFNGFVKYNQSIFSWEDQKRLAAALSAAAQRGARVISTNADHPEVHKLYHAEWKLSSVSRASVIAASSDKRRKTSELFVVSAHGAA